MKTMLLTAGALATAFLTARGQDRAAIPSPGPSEWLAPIHTLPDDPVGGAYGRWAAGPDYKVRFDDGFTFYPVLGESYPRNLPLRWRTERIAVGSHDVVAPGESAVAHPAAWRYELRYGQVTEAYDVRSDGVEQRFVLHQPVAASGDLVVHGRVTTELRGLPATKGGLVFRDAEGKELVHYGRAIAFDQAGRRTDVTTTLDGDRVALRLSGTWLEQATYPVTIDPLTARVVLGTSTNPAASTAVVANPYDDEIAVAYSRASSATDYDLYVHLRNPDFTSIALVFTDITASHSTRTASLAFVYMGRRFVVAFERDFGTSAGVRLYLHDGGNHALGSGTLASVATPAGSSDRYPSVGGNDTVADATAYVVFQRDVGVLNTASSRVYCARIDATTAAVGAPTNLRPQPPTGNDYDAEFPCITQTAGFTYSGAWLVVWQEFNHTIANDDWDVSLQRIERNGSLNNATSLSNVNTRHRLRPVVAGTDGRFLVSFLQRDNTSSTPATTGNEISAQRIVWNQNQSPWALNPQTVAQSASNTLRASVLERPIAYDTRGESHWALAWRTTANDLYVARLGYTGRVVEQATVFSDVTSSALSVALCYNGGEGEFPLVFTTNEGTNPAYGVRFQYPSAAQAVLYGLGCIGDLEAENRGLDNRPYLGSEFFELRLSQGVPNVPTLLFLGRAPAQIPIPGGCHLNLDPTMLVFIGNGVSSGSGSLDVPLALPDSIPPMTVYWQMFQVDLAGNITTTRGLRTDLR